MTSGFEEPEGLCHLECGVCLLFFTNRTMKAHVKTCTGPNAPNQFVLNRRVLLRQQTTALTVANVESAENHVQLNRQQHVSNMLSVGNQIKVATLQGICAHGNWVATGKDAMCTSCGVLSNRRLYEGGEVAEEAAPPRRMMTVKDAQHLDTVVDEEEDDDDDDDEEDADEEDSDDEEEEEEESKPSKKTKTS